jgi:uncharacterized damage-inducible protein DinB
MNLGLVEMLRYNAWAGRTLLDACRDLTDAQLQAQLAVTSGSVRDLLLHIVGGQQAYIHLVQGLLTRANWIATAHGPVWRSSS